MPAALEQPAAGLQRRLLPPQHQGHHRADGRNVQQLTQPLHQPPQVGPAPGLTGQWNKERRSKSSYCWRPRGERKEEWSSARSLKAFSTGPT